MHVTTQDRASPTPWLHAARGACIGLSILGLVLLGIGCDSGASNDGGTDLGGDMPFENTGSVMVNLRSSSSGASTSSAVEKANLKASGTLTVGFHYENDSGSDCTLSTSETVNSIPYNESFDPTTLNETCSNPADFDGVQVEFTSGSGSPESGLVLFLLVDGTEITADNDASDGLSVSETVSENVDLPDDIGDGGGEDDDGDAPMAPSAPSGLTGTSGDSQVKLSWEAVREADTYNVYRSTRPGIDASGNPLASVEASSTSHPDGDAENGTTYYYRVTAVQAGEEGDPSNEIQKTPFPSPPENRP